MRWRKRLPRIALRDRLDLLKTVCEAKPWVGICPSDFYDPIAQPLYEAAVKRQMEKLRAALDFCHLYDEAGQ